MLHKILTFCMLKSTQGMIVTFLVVMNKSIPPRIFFQLLPRFPLTCAKNPVYYYCCAGVAQLVEQLIRNQQVAGSSPATSSINRAGFRLVILRGLFLCFLYKNSSACCVFHNRALVLLIILSFFPFRVRLLQRCFSFWAGVLRSPRG